MFEHLDDTRVEPLDAERLWSGVVARSLRLRARRRGLVAGLGVAGMLPVVVGYVAWRDVQPHRVHVFDAPTTAPTPPAAAGPIEDTVPARGVERTITVLVVGTDRGLQGHDGPVVADIILVVRIDPAASRRVLTVPRDLRVVDDRTGADVRIGSLVEDRAALAHAVSGVAGVTIDHYLESDSDGFAAIADALGGVRMQFGRAVRDGHSGFGTDGGCETFDGAQLRAYVRSRYMESWSGTEWQLDPTSDVGRMVRLQDLVARVVAEVVDGAVIPRVWGVPASVDFGVEIVIAVVNGESPGCENRLVGVTFDSEARRVGVTLVLPGGARPCAAVASSRTYVFAVPRSRLPALPFRFVNRGDQCAGSCPGDPLEVTHI